VTPFVETIPTGAVVVDVRWYLDGRGGRDAYEQGHIPGAVWVDLDHDLAAHDRPATEGRHPLPSPEHFAAAMGRLGINRSSTVVAYDDTGGLTAGRLVVMLRWLGVAAAVLDGGLATWTADGQEVEIGPGPTPTPTHFEPAPWPADHLATTDQVADLGGAVLLDARARERFTGEAALAIERPGHIPDARSAPWAAVLGPDGTVRDVAELREHFTTLGVGDTSDVIASCGSGVSACMNVLALEHAGFAPARLYVASWSGWSADPERPAVTGD
jgi:thiosulfate/3-mercaptopyruvate sulfurtransferase